MRGLKIYSIVSQFIFQTLLLVVLGIYLGRLIDGEQGLWQGILGCAGGLIGVIGFIIMILKMGEKNGRKDEH